jgi:hypothetical protein
VNTEFRRLWSSRVITPQSIKPSSILRKCSYLKQDSVLGIVQQWIAQEEDIFQAKHMLLQFHNAIRGDRNFLCLGITTITVQNITLKNTQISLISHYIQVCFSNKLNINRLSFEENGFYTNNPSVPNVYPSHSAKCKMLNDGYDTACHGLHYETST